MSAAAPIGEVFDAIERGERTRAEREEAPPPPDALRWRLDAIASLLPRRREFPTLTLWGQAYVDRLMEIGGSMRITTFGALEASLDGTQTIVTAELDIQSLRVSAIHEREATEDEIALLEAHGVDGKVAIADPVWGLR